MDTNQFSEMLKKAQSGDAVAQSKIGVHYYAGDCVTRDLVKAHMWFDKAAAQGEVHAIYNLGVCYYHGDGCPIDIKKARQYFERAARMGHEAAKGSLAILRDAGL